MFDKETERLGSELEPEEFGRYEKAIAHYERRDIVYFSSETQGGQTVEPRGTAARQEK